MTRTRWPPLIVLLLTLVLCGGFNVVVANHAAATLRPANGEIVDMKKLGYGMANQWELFQLDGDQSTPDVRLTERDGADTGVAFSPDGSQIAWSFYPDNQYLWYGSDIWAMDIGDTSSMTNLTGAYDPFDSHFEGAPDWSPDGTKLAMITMDQYWPTVTSQVAIWDLASKTMTDLVVDTDPRMDGIDKVAWSPDGSTLAFAIGQREADGSQNPDTIDIRLLDLASGSTRDIALPGAQGSVDWSPDGRSIVATSSEPGGGNSDIVIIDAATGVVTDVVAASPYDDITPAWSPDGTKIAYASPKASNSNDANYSEIYSFDLVTRQEVRLTNDAFIDAGPAWRPIPRHYSVTAFGSPVDTTATNVAKAGRTIPVKWQVMLDGVPVTDAAQFLGLSSAQVPTTAGPPSDDVIEVYSGSSGLQYLGDGWWQFNWKTPKGYAGQTRIMTVRLDDGTSRSAYFDFR